MQIEKVLLNNFRSYISHEARLSKGINIVIGPNASGKTNLLESVYVSARGKSFRGPLRSLIAHNKDWFRIDTIDSAGKKVTVKVQQKHEKLTKEFIVGAKVAKRLSVVDQTPVTLFEPSHLRLLSGSPERRREFLDEILSQLDPVFASEKNSYLRALKQRNNLLKQESIEGHVFVWDLKLAQHGAYIIEKRVELSSKINELATGIYRELTGKKYSIEFLYKASVTSSYKDNLLRKITNNLALDKARGHTTFGPHKDDVEILINSFTASESASRGETRTLVIALKMIEMQILEEGASKKPIILLDDVFSELDGRRRKLLTKTLSDYQTIITTTDADIISKQFLDHSNIIPTKTN